MPLSMSSNPSEHSGMKGQGAPDEGCLKGLFCLGIVPFPSSVSRAAEGISRLNLEGLRFRKGGCSLGMTLELNKKRWSGEERKKIAAYREEGGLCSEQIPHRESREIRGGRRDTRRTVDLERTVASTRSLLHI